MRFGSIHPSNSVFLEEVDSCLGGRFEKWMSLCKGLASRFGRSGGIRHIMGLPRHLVEERISKVEDICAKDLGDRGIQPLAQHVKGNLLSAAKSIACHANPSVGIITGFYIPNANPPSPETDGPIGSALLAMVLAKLGIPVRIAIDELCLGAVASILDASSNPKMEVPIDIVPIQQQQASSISMDCVLDKWRACDDPPISHVVSIERAGVGADGRIYNMRGMDVTKFNPSFEKLFSGGPWETIGIGDGGNELGMGSLPRSLITTHVRHGDKIACVVPCDHLVVAGVSNWGAWGLLAALGILNVDWKDVVMEHLSVEVNQHALDVCVTKGKAVDGVRLAQSMSVDGLEWPVHAQVLKEICNLVPDSYLQCGILMLVRYALYFRRETNGSFHMELHVFRIN